MDSIIILRGASDLSTDITNLALGGVSFVQHPQRCINFNPLQNMSWSKMFKMEIVVDSYAPSLMLYAQHLYMASSLRNSILIIDLIQTRA